MLTPQLAPHKHAPWLRLFSQCTIEEHVARRASTAKLASLHTHSHLNGKCCGSRQTPVDSESTRAPPPTPSRRVFVVANTHKVQPANGARLGNALAHLQTKSALTQTHVALACAHKYAALCCCVHHRFGSSECSRMNGPERIVSVVAKPTHIVQHMSL